MAHLLTLERRASRKVANKMKVLVNKSWRGMDHSFILKFNDQMVAKDIKRVLKGKMNDLAIRKLVKKSIAMAKVPPKDRHRAKLMADFVVGEGYTAERLA